MGESESRIRFEISYPKEWVREFGAPEFAGAEMYFDRFMDDLRRASPDGQVWLRFAANGLALQQAELDKSRSWVQSLFDALSDVWRGAANLFF